MCKNRLAISCLVLLVSLVSHLTAQDAEQVSCIGRVVDHKDEPVTGAKVKLYEMVYRETSHSFDTRLAKQATTDAFGTFSFRIIAGSNGYRYGYTGYVVAEKEGLAFGWANWDMRKNQGVEIKLGEPKELKGIVVDENERPVSGAEVSIRYMRAGDGENTRYLSRVASELLTVKTDISGAFIFTNLPAEATAEFLVKKTGRAMLGTWDPDSRPTLQYSPGQTDIKLLLPVEAKIEGIVAEKDTGEPVAEVKLIALQDRPRFTPLNSEQEPVSSKEDGTFSINALAGDRYILQVIPPRKWLADWVSEPIEVRLDIGETKTGVRVQLIKGGTLKVLITEAATKKPIEHARVSISHAESGRGFPGYSDKDGIARIRLVPGEYLISVYRQTYKRPRRREIVTIENGKTASIEWELTSEPTSLFGRLPSLVGRPLPELKDLKVELSPADVSDRMLLICLWDMEQRPSRYCISQLAEQAEQLKQKGVTIVAMQVSKIDENALNEWVKKQNIPFPVGMVEGDVEKTKFTWGVRSLPWLILTDRKHIITSSGFAVAELSKEIEAIIQEQD
jgi:hypothetical protein